MRLTRCLLVAATNVDLGSAVEEGAFRRDLLARLGGYTIVSPSLRDRQSDILLLLRHFLRLENSVTDIDVEAAECLLYYEWPMNVRELRTLASRLALRSRMRIELKDLPAQMRAVPRESTTHPSSPTREQLENALRQFDGNIAAMATHFGKARVQVYRCLAKFAINADAFRTEK
jgi:transcriptional regulator of acetoin/glycerol metabolism